MTTPRREGEMTEYARSLLAELKREEGDMAIVKLLRSRSPSNWSSIRTPLGPGRVIGELSRDPGGGLWLMIEVNRAEAVRRLQAIVERSP